MGADDRARGALLAGLTVAAVALGGWWWREAAPATGPVGPTPSPSSAESPVGSGLTFQIDPATGRVVDLQGADPEDSVILHQEPGAAQAVPLWADRSHLDSGSGPLVRQVNPSSGERLLLIIGCTGQGTLMVTYSGADGDAGEAGPDVITCPTASLPLPLTARGGPLRVEFTVSGGEVDLDARLASMF